MKKTFLFLSFLVIGTAAMAQKKTTTSATVAFDASTAIDALPKAENKTVIAAVDTKTGSVQFEATVKNFAFSNPKIQEHFNGDKWLHSDAHPKFTFKGKITDLAKANFTKDGTYTVPVSGDLTIKGVTKEVTTPATIVVKGEVLNATADFSIKLADYGITGVPIDAGKVAKEPKITVSAEFK
ncbi:MAG TPA: YceI family protein [Chitinophagaceae bacterium]|nr:YceI family protein [Chitinophagaceae bacterium]